MNGPMRGANTTSDQLSYDLIYKDILINSNLVIPVNNTWTYTLRSDNFNSSIYKAEIISSILVFSDTSGIPATVKNQSIILSIPQLNGNILSIPGNENTQGSIFCQIPDNCTPLNLNNKIISLFQTSNNYESIQYYNPPLNKLNQINIQWYDVFGKLLESTLFNSFSFTLRIYYLQKRINTTAISIPLINFSIDSKNNSIFQPLY